MYIPIPEEYLKCTKHAVNVIWKFIAHHECLADHRRERSQSPSRTLWKRSICRSVEMHRSSSFTLTFSSVSYSFILKKIIYFLNCIIIPSEIPGMFSCTQSVHWTRSKCEVRHGHSAIPHAINPKVQVELLENAVPRRELCRNASIAERAPWHIFLVKTSYKFVTLYNF